MAPYTGADQTSQNPRFAIEYGPILYAVVGNSQGVPWSQYRESGQLGRELAAVDGSPLHFHVKGHSGVTLLPYWQVKDETFTCFPAEGQEQA